MKNTYLYAGLFLIGLSLLIHISSLSREYFTDISGTDISGNSLGTSMAHLLELIIPYIKFNTSDVEPTDQTISRVFLEEDQAHLQELLAADLKKRVEGSLSSA